MWIDVNDRLPEIPADAPDYAKQIDVLAAFESGDVREMRYAIQLYNKTPKGREPRWEESHGRIAHSQPTHWCPLPSHPAKPPLFHCEGTFFRISDYTQAIDCDMETGDPHWEQAEFRIPTKWLDAIGAAEQHDVQCSLTVNNADDVLTIEISKLPCSTPKA